MAAYANDKGKVDMNQTTLPSAPNIHINSTDNKGMGLFANNGGVINAEKNYIKVENGSTGISAIGANGASKSTIFSTVENLIMMEKDMHFMQKMVEK